MVVAGNHDYPLIEPWLARRAEQEEPEPLGVEQLLAPAAASPMLDRLAAWAAPARVLAAYPGLWLRSDVYAMHGHYLDCHLTVPTLERLSIGTMGRVLGRSPRAFTGVEDYEAVTGPVYAWRDAVARHAGTGDALNGMATMHAWRALAGSRGRGRRVGAEARSPSAAGRRLRTRVLVRAFPLAVGALNRAGIGPLRAKVSAGELRRAGLRAMGEVSARLGLGEAHVVFGHTHRAGPLPGDDEREWRAGHMAADASPPAAAGAGARLINAGCWTYDSIFLTATPGESPYWPGTCVLLEDSGPPMLKRLLLDRTHAQLRPAPA